MPDTTPSYPETAAEPLDTPSSWRDDLIAATAFLTRLPVGNWVAVPAGLTRALRAFPLVGGLIGLAGALVYWLATVFGLAPLAAALLAIGATVWLTGALHEDGLADCADGFGGGRNREAKLAIMRDSRIGSYGVLALAISVGLRAAALADLPPADAVAALVAAHAASRAAMPLLLALLEPARSDGLAASLGRPSDMVLAQAVILGVLLCALVTGPFAGIVALSFAALVLAGLETLARRQIGGYTGDVLGAAQQVTEVAILLALSALW
ncbi:MAG: adenosylcobinamide-GDP ribazoletransferase [Proteobacteria bacterium]|nr:adenosylcobinamide-GDP ribazoletransferase [Pseudomonadota bacterium]